ncbi:MAG TPA: DUF167 domain-containing protein [Thermodesulfobacteriota bacterium]|nr:DUF167 domain-containing protein [Thermodesulfobacteriota bacterium]
MKISVKVKPNSKENQVAEKGPNQLLVKVKAPAQENRANQEVIKTLAEYFHLPKSRISIVAGFRSKQKVVEIKDS